MKVEERGDLYKLFHSNNSSDENIELYKIMVKSNKKMKTYILVVKQTVLYSYNDPS